MRINVSGPDGNVFCLLGYARRIQKQLAKAGCPLNDKLAKVLKEYPGMRYDDILDALEDTEFFEFTGRKEDA